jgi:hypothetical protein
LNNYQVYREQLQRVLCVYPSYREYLRGTDYPEETFNAWCEMLSYCDIDDVRHIVTEIVAGTREPHERFQKPDAMPRNIVSEANHRRSRRNEKSNQVNKYGRGGDLDKLRTSDVKFGRASHMAISVGTMVRHRQIDRDENDKRMKAIMHWLRNESASEPDWDWILSEQQQVHA